MGEFKFDPQLLLAVLSMLGAAVWTVGAVRTTTAVLTGEIKHLRGAIDRLYVKADCTSRALHKMEHRVTRIEAQTDQ